MTGGPHASVTLVRHAQTRLNAERRYQGHSAEPLSAHGRARAADLTLPRATHVWSSDLPRATETATLAGLSPTLDARLRELDFGEMEGKRFEELDRPTQQRLLDPDLRGFAAPGGESTKQMRARLRAFFGDLDALRADAAGEAHHVVVTHGGVFRLLGVDGVPPGGVHTMTLRAILDRLA